MHVLVVNGARDLEYVTDVRYCPVPITFGLSAHQYILRDSGILLPYKRRKKLRTDLHGLQKVRESWIALDRSKYAIV